MKLAKATAAAYRTACRKSFTFVQKHSDTAMFAAGAALLVGGMTELSHAGNNPANLGNLQTWSEAQFNQGLIKGAVGNLFWLVEGAFGALIMVVAGLGAIIAAAMGAYRAAVGMLVVALGAFILRALVSLFFGQDYFIVTQDAAQAAPNIGGGGLGGGFGGGLGGI